METKMNNTEVTTLVLTEQEKSILKRISNLFPEIDMPTQAEDFDDISLYDNEHFICTTGYGFIYSVCTSSYENGPDVDFSKELEYYLKAIGIQIVEKEGKYFSEYGEDTYCYYTFMLMRTMNSFRL